MKLQQLFESTKDIVKKYNITKRGKGPTGLDEDKGIWYGWSHRAVAGFKIGDKIFDPEYGSDSTPYNKHGTKTIKNLDDAKSSAEKFAEYVG